MHTTSRSTRAPRLRLLLLGLGLVAACGACGGASPGGSVTGAPAEPELRSTDLLITTDALPDGWRDSNAPGVDYRVSVCGVDLEPQPPVRATSVRFSRGPLGPFLEQHVRVYDDDGVAARVAGQLRESLPGCASYDAGGSAPGSPAATFTVEPLTVAGAPDGSVAWRQVAQGDLPITSDLVLVPRGPAAVVLMSYAIRDVPDPRVLEQAVAALPDAD